MLGGRQMRMQGVVRRSFTVCFSCVSAESEKRPSFPNRCGAHNPAASFHTKRAVKSKKKEAAYRARNGNRS